jgi:hypothetical protein
MAAKRSAKQLPQTLTSDDTAALQRARREIETVKAAIYMGKRGEALDQTFTAIAHAETLLQMAVILANATNREEGMRRVLNGVADQIMSSNR